MTKISALSDIGTSVASNDAFVLVDVSDPTTPNKKDSAAESVPDSGRVGRNARSTVFK
jgi:hypothetical protein